MTSREEFETIVKIVERAERIGVVSKKRRITSIMDVENAHKHFNIRLKEWLECEDEYEFLHDFVGIANNIDRGNPTNFNLFVPRFAGQRR